MAYQEPGTIVRQQFEAAAANIQSVDQVLVVVGEMYEVFEDEEAAAAYDALTDAGAQTFVWPAKKTTSVVDLAGVRKSIAEVDSQLAEYAPYPLAWSLRDPSTSAVYELDPLTDVSAIDQDGFTVAEGVSAAVARDSGSGVSAAKNREFHLESGGFISAGVVTGDRVRLESAGVFSVLGTVDVAQDDNIFFTPDGHDLSVATAASAGDTSLIVASVDDGVVAASGWLEVGSGATKELVPYSAVVGSTNTFTVSALVFAHAVGEDVKVVVQDTEQVLAPAAEFSDLVTNSGYLTIASGDLTDREGSRVAIWVEQQAVVDGTTDAVDGNLLGSATLSLSYADVGKKITIWTDDTALSGSGTVTNDVYDDVAGTPFAATDVGKYMRLTIGGIDYFVRITGFTSNDTVSISSGAPNGTVTAGNMMDMDVRMIKAVDAVNNEFVVDGAAFTTGLSAVPLVLHSAIFRDLVDDTSNSDTVMRYSGSAVSGATGFDLWRAPIDIYKADTDLTYEIFPAFELLVTYRALDIASVNDPLTAYEISDLTAAGSVTKANDLLWAGQAALVAMGSDDTPILLMPIDLFADAVAGSKTGYPEDQNEALGYLNALDLMEMKEGAYFMVPLTRNSTVRDAFVTHVLAMSQPEEKKERVTFLTYALPLGEVESTTGIIEPGFDGGNKRILDSGQNFLSEHQLIPGNAVVITTPAEFAGDYVVAAGSTEDELVLEGDSWLQSSGVFTDDAKEFTQTDASFGGQTGAITSFTLNVTEITAVLAGANVTDADVGRSITILGSTTPGNDGTFVITGVTAPDTVTYENAAGATEAGGAATYTVVSDKTVGVGTAGAFKDVEAGDYLLLGTETREITAIGANGSLAYAKLTYTGLALTGVNQTVSILRTHVGVNYHAKPLDESEQASALKAISQARGSRRVVHMWPDSVGQITGTDAQGNDVEENVPSYFAAAAEAGRDSIMRPERSSTGESLAGFVSLEHSNFYFKRTQLNTIAEGGWTILHQPAEGGPIKVRHLLTTDMSTVKTQELSVTKNVDNMAKVKRASADPLLNDENGRVNITQQFISALAFPLQGILDYFVSQEQLVAGDDGTQPYAMTGLRQSPVFEDEILEDVEMNVPVPGNRLTVTFII